MTHASSAPLLILLLAFGFHSGQAQQPVPEGGTAASRALDAAEQRWRKSRPEAYEFSIEVRCFCLGIVDTPPRYLVIGEKPTPASPVPARSADTYDHFNTVDKLFVRIREVIRRGEHKAAVAYHDTLGYPLVADLDPRDRVFDDELFFRVHDFKAR